MENALTVGHDDVWIEKEQSTSRLYRIDVGQLIRQGDSLTGATWSVSPAGGLAASEGSVLEATISVRLAGGTPKKWYAATCSYTTAKGDVDRFTVRVFVKEDAELSVNLGSALFPNKFAAVKRLRNDRLMLMGKSALPKMDASFDYLWSKLQAAEAEISHELRVPLAPTRFFPAQPTPAQLEALDGAPWGIDPGYDYNGSVFQPDSWGLVKLRNKPIVSIVSARFDYPGVGDTPFEMPASWLQVDRKYATVQFVPNGSLSAAMPLSNFVMQSMASGRTIPMALKFDYVAGLQDVDKNYPDLVDVVYKTASLKIIEDAFLPSSGSISADGLSQSISFEAEQHSDAIQRVLHGPKGSNGGLMTAIHGIRVGFLGG